MRRYTLLLCLFLVSLYGCATGPKYTEVQSKFPAIEADKGRIYFYRASNYFGSGIQPDVLLNGQTVGQSKPGGFFFADRTPGDYEVVMTSEVEKKLTFQLDKGEEKYIRMTVGLGIVVYRVYPELVDKARALNEMKELSYTGHRLK